ncbi:MAG: hypothetical protein JW717_10330 [Marinilabiliaceae bacterium]|nr:hypothetical protein [Marinilabiliaceae bacterium]
MITVNITRYILLLVLICSINSLIIGQTNKKFKGTKHTSKRELAKRIREGEEKNQADMPFASVPKTSMQTGMLRDDMIWKSESGNTIYNRAGNISIFEPCRYGVSNGLELQSHVLIDYWVPNLFVKKRWYNKNKWFLSTRHGLYSAYSGLNFAKDRNMTDIIDSGVSVPFVLGVKNELLISRAFIKDYSCTPNQPSWILNTGIGFDFGVPFETSELNEIEGHFIANRSASMIDNGYFAYIFAGAIIQVNRSILVNASLKYFYGSFSGNHAVEQKTMAEFFLSDFISASVGYKVSIAGYQNTSAFGIIPVLDITWYLGKKESREKGLFGKKMK